MKSTNAEERVKRNKILDKFCQPRNLWYEPVDTYDHVDAKLWFNTDAGGRGGKMVGLAKVKSCATNYGAQPSVPVDRHSVDFLFELSKLAGVKGVLIMKFRDKTKYTRLEDIDNLSTTQKTVGKTTKEMTLIPINCFTDL